MAYETFDVILEGRINVIPTPSHKSKQLDRTQCSDLLERVASSVELKRAARLREFLRYVGQRWLEEDNVQISEQEIGVQVFGRPVNYDTSIDNIVRVNASELRKRITTYFSSEGAEEPILIEIPRGSYTPHFHLRSVEQGLSPAAKPESEHSQSVESDSPVYIPEWSRSIFVGV